MEGTSTRERIIALLRSLADLLESNQQVPNPGVDASFFPGTAEQTQAIMTALDLPWKASRQEQRDQNFDGNAGSSINGFGVTIFAKADDVGAQTGVREIPVWQLRPEIAALLAEVDGNGGES